MNPAYLTMNIAENMRSKKGVRQNRIFKCTKALGPLGSVDRPEWRDSQQLEAITVSVSKHSSSLRSADPLTYGDFPNYGICRPGDRPHGGQAPMPPADILNSLARSAGGITISSKTAVRCLN